MESYALVRYHYTPVEEARAHNAITLYAGEHVLVRKVVGPWTFVKQLKEPFAQGYAPTNFLTAIDKPRVVQPQLSSSSSLPLINNNQSSNEYVNNNHTTTSATAPSAPYAPSADGNFSEKQQPTSVQHKGTQSYSQSQAKAAASLVQNQFQDVLAAYSDYKTRQELDEELYSPYNVLKRSGKLIHVLSLTSAEAKQKSSGSSSSGHYASYADDFTSPYNTTESWFISQAAQYNSGHIESNAIESHHIESDASQCEAPDLPDLSSLINLPASESQGSDMPSSDMPSSDLGGSDLNLDLNFSS